MQDAPPRAVLVLSTMRAGSTLLKALLGAAPDVSHLPEVDFQRFRGPRAATRLSALAPEPIVVLKRPAWLHETASYPRLPELPDLRAVVLVRDAYETVRSARKMALGRWAQALPALGTRLLVERYWAPVTRRLLDLHASDALPTALVRYEDLVQQPVVETGRLFDFIGSAQSGLDHYTPSGEVKWRWGKDDGGEKIRTLQVQPPPPTRYDDRTLLGILQHSAAVAELRQRLDYAALPAAG